MIPYAVPALQIAVARARPVARREPARTSTLILNNKSPNPLPVSVTLVSLDGNAHQEAVMVPGDGFLDVDVAPP